MRFAPVSQVAKADVPSYVRAEIERARLDSANQQKKYQQRQNLLAGGATAYDKFTGDDTPIRDSVDSIVSQLRGGDVGGVASAMPTGSDYAGMAADMSGGVADTAQQYADMAEGIPMGSASALPEMAMDSMAEGAVDSAADGATAGFPLVSALRGGGQLMEGDAEGAAMTGLQAYLSSLGPYGIAAGLALGLLT